VSTTARPSGAAAMMLRGKAARSGGALPAQAEGTDAERLASYEARIEAAKVDAESALKAARARFAIEAGTALAAIRDGALFRAGGHDTFESYIADRWDMDRTRAYQMIDAAPVMAAMSKIFYTPPVESHARALLPAFRAKGEEAIREVHAVVQQGDGKVTARTVRLAAEGLGYKPTPPPGGRTTAEEKNDPTAADQAAALVRLEQAVAALRAAHRGLRGTVMSAAVAADPVRGADLAREVQEIADELGRAAVAARRTRR
jgi:hypothetical protein